MEPLEGNGKLKYDATKDSKEKNFYVNNMNSVMHRNGFFSTGEDDWYNAVNRFSWVDHRNHIHYNREYLFFTKPDLYLMDGSSLQDAQLSHPLKDVPIFIDAYQNHREVLGQLQYSINDINGRPTPFMFLLTNAVTSKLDLPGISAESQESTSNIYGTSITYRTHSLKSDNGYDFTLSFNDTKTLEVYTLAKIYDEYIRMNKTGQIDVLGDHAQDPKSKANIYKDYIINRVIPEQFSIYKFLIADDGETIVYYAKATGCYITDVPRAEFGDPSDGPVKLSLSFHANFIEDNNPLILTEFNNVSLATNLRGQGERYSDIWTPDGINNEWVVFPCIRAYNDIRSTGKGVYKDYRLKWTREAKTGISAGTGVNGGTTFYGPYHEATSGLLSDLLGGYVAPEDCVPPKGIIRTVADTVVDTVSSTVNSGLDWVRDQITTRITDPIKRLVSPDEEEDVRTVSLRVEDDGQTISFAPLFDYLQDGAQFIYDQISGNRRT